MADTATPAVPETPAPAPPATAVTELDAMTAEERTSWRATGAYPERRAPEPAPAEAPPEVPQQEADSAQPDDAISEAARTLRRNRAAERKARIQDEINDLTRKRHEAERELEAIAARKRALDTPTPTPSTPSAVVPEGEPLIDQFDGDFTAFLRARDQWLLSQFEQRQHAQTEAQRQAEAERQAAERLAAHHKRLEETRQQFADYDAVIGNPELPQLPMAVLHALQDSPLGPRLAYRLARDPERMRVMASMTPHAAVLELGRLAADLDAPVKAAPKTVTQAPPPAPSLGERPGIPSDEITDAAMSGDFARYKAAMNAQARAAGRNW